MDVDVGFYWFGTNFFFCAHSLEKKAAFLGYEKSGVVGGSVGSSVRWGVHGILIVSVHALALCSCSFKS